MWGQIPTPLITDPAGAVGPASDRPNPHVRIPCEEIPRGILPPYQLPHCIYSFPWWLNSSFPHLLLISTTNFGPISMKNSTSTHTVPTGMCLQGSSAALHQQVLNGGEWFSVTVSAQGHCLLHPRPIPVCLRAARGGLSRSLWPDHLTCPHHTPDRPGHAPTREWPFVSCLCVSRNGGKL